MKRRVRIEAAPDGSMTFRMVDAETDEVLESGHISMGTLESVIEYRGWYNVEDDTMTEEQRLGMFHPNSPTWPNKEES